MGTDDGRIGGIKGGSGIAKGNGEEGSRHGAGRSLAGSVGLGADTESYGGVVSLRKGFASDHP